MEVPLDLPFPYIVNNKTLKKPRFINDKRMNERLKVEGWIRMHTYYDLWNFLGKTASIATQQLDKGSAEQ